jgi:hypothetical protein
MAYRPVDLSPDTPAVVREVLAGTCDKYLHDVHAMLRLPLPSTGITVACSLSATAVLVNVVSGVSVTLFDPSDSRDRGRKFRQALELYYPWDLEPPGATIGAPAAATIYKLFRNPMAHALGFQDGGRRGQIFVRRMYARPEEFGLGEYVLGLIEASATRPNGELGNNVPTLHHDPPRTSLFVEPFYWGGIASSRPRSPPTSR